MNLKIFACLMAVCVVAQLARARPSPLPTAFTYQGNLRLNGTPVNGPADLQFTLWDSASGPNQIGGVFAVSPVTVVNGGFTVQVDFGAVAFNGDARWLQIAARSPSGTGAFTTLSPRQPVTAVPYALQTRGIFVNASSNVGIGTTSPAARLHVKSSDEVIRIDGGAVGGANAAYMTFYDSAGTRKGYVGDGSLGDEAIFLGSDSGDVVLQGPAGRMVNVKPNGNVGIGTGAPNERLTVAGSMEVGTGSGDYQHLRIGGGNSDGFIYGSYPHFGDGIHLGYNYYANAAGTNQIVHPDGGTSRLSAGYGSISMATAPPFGGEPLNRMVVDPSGNVNFYRGNGFPIGSIYPDPAAGNPTFPAGTPVLSAGAFSLYGPAGNTRFGVRSRLAGSTYFPNQAEVFLDAPNGTRVISMSTAGGESTTPGTSGTIICTNFLATVVKNFLVPNPDDPKEDITYACLEGPECGMYMRGTASLVGGRAHIYLPPTFSSLASKEGLTVILTPLSGDSLGLACVDRTIEGFEVVELMQGRGNYEFDWEVKAVRRGMRDYKVVHPWTEYARGSGTAEDLWQRRMADIAQRNAKFAQEDTELGPRP